MKFTKFDRIQLLFNILLIAATVLNIIYLCGIGPQWLTTVGLVLAVAGCLMTNILATGEGKGTRTEVSGSPTLAGLTYLTGALWVITFGIGVFFNMNLNG